ncbi:hypothetical protein WN943_013673 [Citrus x changshan-huyou]
MCLSSKIMQNVKEAHRTKKKEKLKPRNINKPMTSDDSKQSDCSSASSA